MAQVDLECLIHLADDWPMIAATCPDHPRPVLVGYDDITAVRREAGGFTVTYRCSCGKLRRHRVVGMRHDR